MVAMSAAQWLWDDVVDDAQPGQIASRHPERFGSERLGLIVGLLPQDSGAALRADDRVVGVLEHADTVADADTQGAPRAALPNDHTDDGRLETGHLQQVGGDKRRLATLLGADAGKCPWGVN